MSYANPPMLVIPHLMRNLKFLFYWIPAFAGMTLVLAEQAVARNEIGMKDEMKFLIFAKLIKNQEGKKEK